MQSQEGLPSPQGKLWSWEALQSCSGWVKGPAFTPELHSPCAPLEEGGTSGVVPLDRGKLCPRERAVGTLGG